jgi:hypothetical protein
VVYADAAKFCEQHAELYISKIPAAENFNPTTFNNLTHMGDNVSHIVIAIMKRGDLPKDTSLLRKLRQLLLLCKTC